MSCADYNESLNALLDGEITPAQAAPLVAHIAGCADCTRTLAELAELRAGLALALPGEEVPADLQARIEAMLTPDVLPFRHRWRPAPSWLAAGALAAALMLALLPRHDETKDLMSVRDAALRGGTGRGGTGLAVQAPAVPGFQLASSRTDVVAGHMAQVAVYIRGGQTITLCNWPANGEKAHGVEQARYRGMGISYWNNGKTEYWVASTGDVQDFVAALRARYRAAPAA